MKEKCTLRDALKYAKKTLVSIFIYENILLGSWVLSTAYTVNPAPISFVIRMTFGS